MKYNIIIIIYYDDRSVEYWFEKTKHTTNEKTTKQHTAQAHSSKRAIQFHFFLVCMCRVHQKVRVLGSSSESRQQERREKYHIETKIPTTNGRIILLFLWNEKCFRKRKLRARENHFCSYVYKISVIDGESTSVAASLMLTHFFLSSFFLSSAIVDTFFCNIQVQCLVCVVYAAIISSLLLLLCSRFSFHFF